MIKTHRLARMFAAALVWACGAAAAQRPFTVADSIAMTQVTDPYLAWMAYRPMNFNGSPDGRWAAMVTRRGDLASGLNHYELRLFSEQELKDILRANRSPARPPGRVVLSMATSTPKHGIEKISWDPGGRFLYCIGREGDVEAGQVYQVQLDGSGHRQMTSHASGVATYVVAGGRVLYGAPQVQDWTQRNRRGYVVGANFVNELSMRDPHEFNYLLEYFLQDRTTGQLRRLDLPTGAYPRDFVLSPDGRYAIYPVQVRSFPAHWRDYGFFREYRELADQSLLDAGSALAPIAEVNGVDPTFGLPPMWVAQYHVIDLETGSAKPLIDAPALLDGLIEVEWSADARTVIVSDSYLPVAGVSAEVAEHRRSLRMIAEVEVDTGAVFPIVDQPERSNEGLRLDLRAIDRLQDGSIEVRWRPSKAKDESVKRYVKRDGRWIPAPLRPKQLRSTHVRLELRQDMNTPADVFAVDPVSGRSVRITELNPQLRELALGKVEPFAWEDRFGRRFHGGLFFPPGYVPGRRLPVVLQTYGFREDEFVVDGPNGMSNGFAARALVNQNLLVLQMPELEGVGASGSGSFEDTGENPRYLAALEAAIDALDRRGYIDPAKVGFIGFSREGLHGQYAVTFTSRPIAAGLLSDFASVSPMCYAMLHGHPLPGATEFERDGLVGAGFWGAGIDKWRERSPLFQLDRIRTPLRLETMGFAPPCSWDMYMILTRHRRPVELVHVPREDHPIQTPWARWTSQQGSVDWFAFWLNGTEDPDPAKKTQYERWRIFREQLEIAKSAPRSSRAH